MLDALTCAFGCGIASVTTQNHALLLPLYAESRPYNLHCSNKVFYQFYIHIVFSHDVTAAILVSQNNEMAAMLVSQTSPLGVELFSYASAFFCGNKFA